MKEETLNRIKTAVDSTDIIQNISGFNPQQFYDLLEVCEYQFRNNGHDISIDGYTIEREQVELCAVINIVLFTYFYMTEDMENLAHIELFSDDILKTYALIVEYENHVNNSNWWEDANEYGLTSYAQATKFYNMI